MKNNNNNNLLLFLDASRTVLREKEL